MPPLQKSTFCLKSAQCPGGEIGRHRRLKISRSLRSCRFDSGLGHHLYSSIFLVFIRFYSFLFGFIRFYSFFSARCEIAGLPQGLPMSIRRGWIPLAGRVRLPRATRVRELPALRELLAFGLTHASHNGFQELLNFLCAHRFFSYRM